MRENEQDNGVCRLSPCMKKMIADPNWRVRMSENGEIVSGSAGAFLALSWREWNNGEFSSSAQREVRFAGGVCMWARTNNPATNHFPAINTLN